MPKTYYDTEEFKRRWFSKEPLESIARSLNVCPASVSKAAKRRGWPNRKFNRTKYYNSPEFKARWYSTETLEDIAFSLEVEPNSVWQAAMRRGFALKKEARGPEFKYKRKPT